VEGLDSEPACDITGGVAAETVSDNKEGKSPGTFFDLPNAMEILISRPGSLIGPGAGDDQLHSSLGNSIRNKRPELFNSLLMRPVHY
jgi:hypothetical protein